MFRIFFFLSFFFIIFFAKAQNSYLYIEGIKGIPFNVISENKEVVKLGKNYSIITYTNPGEKNIDITFLNSNFGKQKFVVDVQPNSSYGYRMGKTDENKFYLIDIVNEGKIIETNSPVNLALSTNLNWINSTQENPLIKEGNDNVKNDVVPEKSKKEKRSDKRKKEEEEKIAQLNNISKPEKIEAEPLKFGISENNSIKQKEDQVKDNKVANSKEIKQPTAKVLKFNNCPKLASDEEIKSIIEKLNTKGDDEAKLLFIKKKTVSGCFTSIQVYSMAQQFETQYGRYSLAKFIVPLTNNPGELLALESLFKYDAYKSKLRKLVEN